MGKRTVYKRIRLIRYLLLLAGILWEVAAIAAGPVFPALPTTGDYATMPTTLATGWVSGPASATSPLVTPSFGCDYTAPANVSLTISGVSSGTSAVTYLLVDIATGAIAQVNPSSPAFTAVPQGLYYAIATYYTGTLMDATVGKLFTEIYDSKGGCLTFSSLVFRVCGTTCDYASAPASVTFTASPSSTVGVSTIYALVDESNGVLVATSNTASFSSVSQGDYSIAAVYYTGTLSLPIGTQLVTAISSLSNCEAFSNTIHVRVCACATPTVGGTATFAGGTLCNTTNAGTVTLSGQTGNVVKWQTSTNGGTTWTDIAGTVGKNLYSFVNAQNSQQFRAVVNSGVGCSDANSTAATITTSAGVCTPASCDKTVGNIVFTAVTPAVSGSNFTHVIILTDGSGVIQYASAPGSSTVANVAAGSYFGYLVSYDNTLTPLPTLTLATALSAIGGSCVAFSGQVPLKVCSANVPPTIAITSPVNITTTSTNPPISGTATALASVTVNAPNGQVCLTTANAAGAWTCSSLTFTVGAQTVTAIASNTAGVSTTATTNFTVVSGVSCPNPSVGGSVAFAGTLPLCSVSNGGSLNLTGNTGSVVKWQTSTNGGTTWTDVANTTTSLAFTNAANNQQYRVVVNNAGSCADATSSPVTITTSAGVCTVACAVLPSVISKN